MAELMAMMGTTAGGTAAGTAAAGTAAGMGGGTAASMFGPSAAAGSSAMANSLLAPQAATPWVTEAAASPEAFARFLSPETFGMGAPPAAGMDPMKTAMKAMEMMNNEPGGKMPQGMSSRPPGYNPSEPMEQQFARIMGWLKENGGRV